MRGHREIAVPHGPSDVDPGVVVAPITRRIIRPQANARTGGDPIYAAVAVNDADRPPVGDPEPNVGRERTGTAERGFRQVELERDAGGELVVAEHEPARDPIIRARRFGERHRSGRREREDDRRAGSRHRATVAWLIGSLGIAGCRPELDELDGLFYDGDGRAVHCAVDLDDRAGNDLASVDSALDRAAARGETVELYAHKPGVSVPMATIDHVLAGARDRGLAFVTYADFAAGGGLGPGLALSFDDSGVDTWLAARPVFQQYDARATFFVTRYARMDEDTRANIRLLADDGHDIAAHSVNHLRAPTYVEQDGLASYLADEAIPSIEVLRADGYDVTSFAYPFGARTEETDEALLAYVPILRSVTFAIRGVSSPCPR